MSSFDRSALTHLRALTGMPDARFRSGQLEAIRSLVEDHARVLVVQRTGWGKSAVYLIATRLPPDRGAGPTVIVSPLLALMRNQWLAWAYRWTAWRTLSDRRLCRRAGDRFEGFAGRAPRVRIPLRW